MGQWLRTTGVVLLAAAAGFLLGPALVAWGTYGLDSVFFPAAARDGQYPIALLPGMFAGLLLGTTTGAVAGLAGIGNRRQAGGVAVLVGIVFLALSAGFGLLPAGGQRLFILTLAAVPALWAAVLAVWGVARLRAARRAVPPAVEAPPEADTPPEEERRAA